MYGKELANIQLRNKALSGLFEVMIQVNGKKSALIGIGLSTLGTKEIKIAGRNAWIFQRIPNCG